MNKLSLIERRINKSYHFHDLLKQFYDTTYYSDVVHCPFHEDTRRSAKVYYDENGQRLYCFTEGKNYTICDLLRLNGQILQDWDIFDNEIEFVVHKEDFSYLDGFVKKEFEIEEFCNKLLNGK